MPQESFALSIVNPDELVQGVQTLVSRIADPAPGTITSLTRAAEDNAAKGLAAAQYLQNDFDAAVAADGIIGKAAGQLKKLAEIKFATQEDICDLKALILDHWWLDNMCWYLVNQRVETVIGAVCHRVELHDAERRANLSPEELLRAAEHYRVGQLPLTQLEKLLNTVREFAASLPSPPTRKKK